MHLSDSYVIPLLIKPIQEASIPEKPGAVYVIDEPVFQSPDGNVCQLRLRTIKKWPDG